MLEHSVKVKNMWLVHLYEELTDFGQISSLVPRKPGVTSWLSTSVSANLFSLEVLGIFGGVLQLYINVNQT